MAAERPVTTYSICACDLEAQQWGVATQSKFLAVGSIVPWAEPRVGAIATQSYANPRYGPEGLALLREGLSAAEVIDRLTGADEDSALRQLGIVDGLGRAASYTGRVPRMGGRRRACYATWREHPRLRGDRGRAGGHVRGDRRRAARGTAARLPRAAAGSRRRPARAAIGRLTRRRARDGATPALRRARRPLASTTTRSRSASWRLYDIHQSLFGQTPRSSGSPWIDELRAEIERRRLGVRGSRTARREPGGTRRRHGRDRPGRARGVRCHERLRGHPTSTTSTGSELAAPRRLGIGAFD